MPILLKHITHPNYKTKREAKGARSMAERSVIWTEKWKTLLVKSCHKQRRDMGHRAPSASAGGDQTVPRPFLVLQSCLQSDNRKEQPFPGTAVQVWAACMGTVLVCALQKPHFSKALKWFVTAQRCVSSQQMLKDHPWKGVSPEHLIRTSTED